MTNFICGGLCTLNLWEVGVVRVHQFLIRLREYFPEFLIMLLLDQIFIPIFVSLG